MNMKRLLIVLCILLCLCGCDKATHIAVESPSPSAIETEVTDDTYDFEADGWKTTTVQPCGHGHLNYTDAYQERIVECSCPNGQNGDTDTERRIACYATGECYEFPVEHND